VSAWLVLGVTACALGAIHARSLVHSALWLAATSAVLATLLYIMGAPVVAVIELSVGVGLVAVLFIFVVGVAGEDAVQARPVVPTLISLALAGPAVLLLAWMVTSGGGLTAAIASLAPSTASVTSVLWDQRAADVLGQVVLIVAGALGVVTILGGAPRIAASRTDRAVKLIGSSMSIVARASLIASEGTVPRPAPAPEPQAETPVGEPVAAGKDPR
jgi:NADH:ubiquinone oxidoreductase subunit 6 (subunit J)